MRGHVHVVKHWPNTSGGDGYGVCECGATIQVSHGQAVGVWHECGLCVGRGVQPDPLARELIAAAAELDDLLLPDEVDELERQTYAQRRTRAQEKGSSD